MTPQQKIKWLVLALDAEWCETEAPAYPLTEEDEELFDEGRGSVYHDAIKAIRAAAASVETGLPCPVSRHYETLAVAMKLPDDSWVGWTFYYGGGKYGDPDAIPWIEDAYDVSCVEEEVIALKRTFTLVRGTENE